MTVSPNKLLYKFNRFTQETLPIKAAEYFAFLTRNKKLTKNVKMLKKVKEQIASMHELFLHFFSNSWFYETVMDDKMMA